MIIDFDWNDKFLEKKSSFLSKQKLKYRKTPYIRFLKFYFGWEHLVLTAAKEKCSDLKNHLSSPKGLNMRYNICIWTNCFTIIKRGSKSSEGRLWSHESRWPENLTGQNHNFIEFFSRKLWHVIIKYFILSFLIHESGKQFHNSATAIAIHLTK